MTPLEHKIIRYINDFNRDNGYSPSVDQIRITLGHKSKGSVHRYLSRLVASGELKKNNDSGRNVYVQKKTQHMPMAGRIAAGSPIEAIAESEQLNFFDRFTDEGLYQLQIKGDSMIDIGISEGDIVLIKPARKAHDKQIVVALIDGADATLKRYYKRGKHVELYAENSNYEPQIYSAERVEIQGVLHSVHKFSL